MYAKWSKDPKLLSMLQTAASSSLSVREALQKLNLSPYGSNYKGFKNACNRLGIDISHMVGKAWLKNRTHSFSKRRPLSELLVENSFTQTSSLRKRLINDGLLENKCYICGLFDWLNRPISLQLDHINGNCFDNRLENLRILCPNCHSQTDTFAGKNTKGKRRPIRTNGFSEARSLNPSRLRVRKTKIDWPTVEDMSRLVWETPSLVLAKNLGVSDKAIEKFCKKHLIPKPPRGHWRKLVCATVDGPVPHGGSVGVVGFEPTLSGV